MLAMVTDTDNHASISQWRIRMRNLISLLIAVLLAACATESAPTSVPTPTQEEPPQIEPKVEPAATPTEEEAPPEEETPPMEESDFRLTSSAFQQGDPIPVIYSCDGENTSPRLTWTNPPAGTQSLALIFDDPDAPGGTWVHWVLFNLPAETRSLPEAVSPDPTLANGALHGLNSWGSVGYGGPCPPGGEHRYFFKLYALDSVLDLEVGAAKEQLLAAMADHIVAEVELMGTYSR
jgi:Raf kinase inhibitor-like YbhB/YbcL family protein